MARYFKPRGGGKTAASKEALAMFEDKEKRTLVAIMGATYNRYMCMISMIKLSSPKFSHVCHMQGNQLADILRSQGYDFGAMEVKVKQLTIDEETNKVQGGWSTEISLRALGWTESSSKVALFEVYIL